MENAHLGGGKQAAVWLREKGRVGVVNRDGGENGM